MPFRRLGEVHLSFTYCSFHRNSQLGKLVNNTMRINENQCASGTRYSTYLHLGGAGETLLDSKLHPQPIIFFLQ